jgi:hypothetical protein
METTKLAWHGEPLLHASVVNRMRGHAAAGRIAQGEYWLHGKGCLLGCCTHGENDAPRFETKYELLTSMEREFGIPPSLAQHLEHLFECAPKAVAAELAVCLVEAIKPGTDTTMVVRRADELELEGARRTEDQFWAFLVAAQEQAQADATPIPKPSSRRKLESTINARGYGFQRSLE